MIDNTVIIIPSLNPDEKFIRVYREMKEAGFCRFVIVDDGSDAEHQEPFCVAKNDGCVLLKHETNLGKGQALKDAFNYVYDNMPDAAAVITIDGDGQHTPKDAVRLWEHMTEHPDDVVFGCRDFNSPNVPTHNRLGNKITAGVFRFLFRMDISDAQTGLRGIPRKYLKAFAEEVEGTRFEYESNVLIYINEQHIPFSEVSIETVYLDDNKSSHFRPVRDSYRIYKPIIKKSTSLKYIMSSAVCYLVDAGLFTLLNHLYNDIDILILQTLLTTGLARFCSSLCNYAINKKIVFESNASVKKSASKYFLLVIVQYTVSWLLCTLLFSLMVREGFIRTVIKLFIDLFLFFVNYRVQKKWVFK